MDDDRVVRLLEEIRDLQRQHLEGYKEALQNQKDSMAFNREAQRRSRQGQWWFLGILLAAMFGLWLAAFASR